MLPIFLRTDAGPTEAVKIQKNILKDMTKKLKQNCETCVDIDIDIDSPIEVSDSEIQSWPYIPLPTLLRYHPILIGSRLWKGTFLFAIRLFCCFYFSWPN